MKASIEHWPVPLIARNKDEVADDARAALPATLAEIYDSHFHYVWRNARRLGVTESSADDVVQDVFMIVQRRIQDYDGRASMQAWIFGILIRVVRDHRRSFLRKGARHVPLEGDDRYFAAEEHGPTPIELVEQAERQRLVERVLSELDEQKRTLLILSELEQWTLREIAELLGSNINTIHSRVRAAKRAFEAAYSRAKAGKGDLP